MRLLQTRYCALDLDTTTVVVRYTRTDVPYETFPAIYEEAARIEAAMRDLPSDYRVLVDLRPAAPRNDPAFEVAIRALRIQVYAGATRVAILVRTAAGMLQTRRHARDDGVVCEVFDDEEQALAYVETVSGRPITSPPASAQRPVRGARAKTLPPTSGGRRG